MRHSAHAVARHEAVSFDLVDDLPPDFDPVETRLDGDAHSIGPGNDDAGETAIRQSIAEFRKFYGDEPADIVENALLRQYERARRWAS